MAPGAGKGLTADRHLLLARDNAAAYVELRKATVPLFHWAGTALFYSAVHYADALLRTMNEPPAGNHDERWRQLAAHVDDSFLEHYLALKDVSQAWRYRGRELDGATIDRAQAGHFRAIVAVVTKAIQPNE